VALLAPVASWFKHVFEEPSQLIPREELDSRLGCLRRFRFVSGFRLNSVSVQMIRCPYRNEASELLKVVIRLFGEQLELRKKSPPRCREVSRSCRVITCRMCFVANSAGQKNAGIR